MSSSDTPEIYEFGPYRLDVREALLTRDGETVPLTPKVHETLVVLLRNAGRLVTREELIAALWPDTFVTEATLSQNVSLLRKALRDGEGDIRYVETRPRRGYRFSATVRRGESAAAAPPRAQPAAVEALVPRAEAPPTPAPRARRLAAVLAALLLGAGGVVVLLRARTPPARPTVALLGIRNAGRPESAWVATAFAEMLTTELAAGGTVRTVPAEAVDRARRELAIREPDALAKETLAKVRADLGADLVVTGSSLVLDGGRVRVDVRVQDARSGDARGAIAETGTEAELFDLAARAGTRLRETLGAPELSAEDARRLARSRPSSPEAARLYAEGLARLRASEPAEARALLEKAVAVEPRYALARGALAQAWSALGYDVKARAEAKAASELASDLGREERLLLEATFRETTKDWARAAQSWRTLFGWFPDDLEYGLRLGEAEVRGGRASEGLAVVDALRGLPGPRGDDPRIDFLESSAAGSLSDFRRQLEAARRGKERAERRGARLLVARAHLAIASAERALGDETTARRDTEEARTISAAAGDVAGLAAATNTLGMLAWDASDYAAARARFEECLALARKIGDRLHEEWALNNLAAVDLDLGRLPEARALLQDSMAIGREIGDTRTLALSEANVGDAFDREGELVKADEHFTHAVALAASLAEPRLESEMERQHGTIRLWRGDLASAASLLGSAVAKARATGTRRSEADALAYLGTLAFERGDFASARREAAASQAIRRELKDQRSADENRFELAAVLLEEGEVARAESEAAAMARVFEGKVEIDAAEALTIVARAREIQGRAADAREAAARAVALARKEPSARVLLQAELLAARLDPGPEGTRALERLADDLGRRGFALLELEARISLAARAADPARGTRLQSLETEAKARGFGRLARLAARLKTRV